MALPLAEGLLAHRPLDPAGLAARFVAWYRTSPAEIGRQTRLALKRIAHGKPLVSSFSEFFAVLLFCVASAQRS